MSGLCTEQEKVQIVNPVKNIKSNLREEKKVSVATEKKVIGRLEMLYTTWKEKKLLLEDVKSQWPSASPIAMKNNIYIKKILFVQTLQSFASHTQRANPHHTAVKCKYTYSFSHSS